jgi:hypothetical protein
MTSTTVDIAPVTAWLITLLNTATGNLVGDGEAPEGADLDDGYIVVHSLPGGGPTFGAPLVSPDDSVTLVYQIDSVGLRPDQVRLISDLVRTTILGRDTSGAFTHSAAIPGLDLLNRCPDSDGPGAQLDVVGEPPNRVWTAAERFYLPTQSTRGDTP